MHKLSKAQSDFHLASKCPPATILSDAPLPTTNSELQEKDLSMTSVESPSRLSARTRRLRRGTNAMRVRRFISNDTSGALVVHGQRLARFRRNHCIVVFARHRAGIPAPKTFVWFAIEPSTHQLSLLFRSVPVPFQRTVAAHDIAINATIQKESILNEVIPVTTQ